VQTVEAIVKNEMLGHLLDMVDEINRLNTGRSDDPMERHQEPRPPANPCPP
jgi:hypothetical protein